MMDSLGPRINVLDVDIKALANVTIATTVVMNMSHGTVKSYKFNT